MLERFREWETRFEERRRARRVLEENRPVSCHEFKFWRRSAMVGFAILFMGSLGNSYVDRERSQAADKRLQEQTSAGRQALVRSSRIVVIDGCNRDFRTISKLRGVFERSLASIEEAKRQGEDISEMRYERSKRFYKQELRNLTLPDCRRARNIITDDPNRHNMPPPPKPLFPSG